MKKILYTALVGNHLKHEGFCELFRRNEPRLKEYCHKWGFELRMLKQESAPEGAGRVSGHPVWIKFGFYNNQLRYELNDGDKCVWMDADTILLRSDFDLTPKKDFSISREPTGKISAGIMGWTKGEFSQRLIDSVWNGTDQDMLPGYPVNWCDQPVLFSALARLSKREQQEHVELWPKYLNGSGRCEGMHPEIYRRLVFRHFAGSRPIEWEWFNHPLRNGPMEIHPL